jgi:ATP-dependent Clp protease ATP-binding subunit ClpC
MMEDRVFPGVKKLIDEARKAAGPEASSEPGLNIWLSVALQRHFEMVKSISPGVDWEDQRRRLAEMLSEGNRGESLGPDELLAKAGKAAQRRGAEKIAERDVVTIILAEAGFAIDAICDSEAPMTSAEKKTEQGCALGIRTTSLMPTPTLNEFGRDLTELARKGMLMPVIGREKELEEVIVTLCRETKRNPVLLGPAGVGKTAVVEALAQRIASDDICDILKGKRIIEIQPIAIMSGAGIVGEAEKRFKKIIEEASQEGILLFIDEVHTILNEMVSRAGGFADLLKPALARGSLACIAATTDDEYRRHFEKDRALERRFSPIRIEEMNREQALEVLRSKRDRLEETRGVKVPEESLSFILEMSDRYLKNRFLPDKAIDLLEQCVAHAVAAGSEELNERESAEVIQKMVGIPLDIESQLAGLREELGKSGLLDNADIDRLIERLRVTMAGLDLRSERPNAIILIAGRAARAADALASIIAGRLFGGPERIVQIDLGIYKDNHDLTGLIGSHPGYVGYEDSLPLHRMINMPWAVLLLKNLHQCHYSVYNLVLNALKEGSFNMADGKKIHICDSVVIITSEGDVKKGGSTSIGFRAPLEEKEQKGKSTPSLVGTSDDLTALCDLIISREGLNRQEIAKIIETLILKKLKEHYASRGMAISWDDDLPRFLAEEAGDKNGLDELERLVDERIAPALARLGYMGEKRAVRLTVNNGKVDIVGISADEEVQ